MNPYIVLGVAVEATEEEIKKAYRALANKHHPDKTSGNTELFKEVQVAYDILSDPVRREKYDRTGDYQNNEIDPDVKINAIIAGLFINIINVDLVNFETEDIVALMCRAVNKEIALLDAGIRKNILLIKKREKIVNKIVKKSGGENPLSAAVLKNIASLHSANEAAAIQLNENIRILEKLSDYEYITTAFDQSSSSSNPLRLY